MRNSEIIRDWIIFWNKEYIQSDVSGPLHNREQYVYIILHKPYSMFQEETII